jgi:hypothetical protein
VTLCTLPFSSGDVVKTLKRLDSASFSLNLFGDIPYFDTEGQIKLCQRERERESLEMNSIVESCYSGSAAIMGLNLVHRT